MPTLNWIGKEKVQTHHLDVPYRVMEHGYGFTHDDGEQFNPVDSGNKIIYGDNLEALKSLLPIYEGKVDCIYIDPPYNTGTEKWIYNDNVNHPKIKKWLGQLVGKESEDLSRHDKWLCMMYPRLQLLKQLLSKNGLIFISIDDNEQSSLRMICDEIFGKSNFVSSFTWRTDGNFDNQAKIKVNHEYIYCYSKNNISLKSPNLIDPNIEEDSKLFKDTIVNTIVKNGKKNPVSQIKLPVGFHTNFEEGIIKARKDSFPNFYEDAIVKDFKLQNSVIIESGWSSKNIFELFIQNNLEPVLDTKGQSTTFYLTNNGAVESLKKRIDTSHVISSLMNFGSTQNMSNELKRMGIDFDFPKPYQLISYILSIQNNPNAIVLDSFAGSGTTAHAVLNLNKQDGGNRKFILIELEDYANTITAERVKRVIDGYGEGNNSVKGIGGDFNFYTLGQSLLDDERNLNIEMPIEAVCSYIWYTETHTAYTNSIQLLPLLGVYENTAYYLNYIPNEVTTLDRKFLKGIDIKASQYIIYADNCLLPKELMQKYNIVFKKIPRDISQF